MAMTGRQLAKAVAAKTRMPVRSVGPVVREAFVTIAAELRAGREVMISGFGTFGTSHHSARTGQNFRTGERVVVPARDIPRLHPAKALMRPRRSAGHPYAWDRTGQPTKPVSDRAC